jgi:hypothetical protein
MVRALVAKYSVRVTEELQPMVNRSGCDRGGRALTDVIGRQCER